MEEVGDELGLREMVDRSVLSERTIFKILNTRRERLRKIGRER